MNDITSAVRDMMELVGVRRGSTIDPPKAPLRDDDDVPMAFKPPAERAVTLLSHPVLSDTALRQPNILEQLALVLSDLHPRDVRKLANEMSEMTGRKVKAPLLVELLELQLSWSDRRLNPPA